MFAEYQSVTAISAAVALTSFSPSFRCKCLLRRSQLSLQRPCRCAQFSGATDIMAAAPIIGAAITEEGTTTATEDMVAITTATAANDGYWYPLAAFGAGALIGGAIASQPRYYAAPANGINPQHYEWCASRYRSYRAFDNTFQPNRGPRQQCLSPYY